MMPDFIGENGKLINAASLQAALSKQAQGWCLNCPNLNVQGIGSPSLRPSSGQEDENEHWRAGPRLMCAGPETDKRVIRPALPTIPVPFRSPACGAVRPYFHTQGVGQPTASR